MRLIDADALVEKAYIMQEPNGFIHSVVTERQIIAVPTIDAVPVVRCKDCKHMAVVGVGVRWCRAWEHINAMGDDGFCCFGERRSE